MAYCTVDQVKLLSKFTVFKTNTEGNPTFSDSEIQALIDRADIQIRSDLSTRIDFSKVTAIGDTYPTNEPIQTLSIFKTTELALVSMHGAQRTVQQITDVQYWQKEYQELREKLFEGSVILVDANGNPLYWPGQRFRNTDRTLPAFGDTKYGEYCPQQEGKFP